MEHETFGSILVVDDDRITLNIVKRTLEAASYSVVTAENADEALENFQAVRFDTVLSDIVMPGPSGIDLLTIIRNSHQDVPVLLMTAYGDMEKALEAIRAGAFDFLLKPFKAEQLLHAIHKAIEHRRLLLKERDHMLLLEEFMQDLETLVTERTLNLMALTLSDRVRNPVTFIGATCRRILERDKLPERVQDDLRDIIDESYKLEGTVNEFQLLLRNHESFFSYEDLNLIIDLVLNVIHKEAAHRGVQLRNSLACGPQKINVQKNLLRMAIFNLIRNAIEATPPGGYVEVTTCRQDDRVILTISDTGKGIPTEFLEKIFDPFFSTKKSKFGIGLPIVKQIVTEHMGTIEVESRENQGTTIRVSFPARWRN